MYNRQTPNVSLRLHASACMTFSCMHGYNDQGSCSHFLESGTLIQVHRFLQVSDDPRVATQTGKVKCRLAILAPSKSVGSIPVGAVICDALSTAVGSAPRSSTRSLVMEAWPALAAIWRGVRPSYMRQRKRVTAEQPVQRAACDSEAYLTLGLKICAALIQQLCDLEVFQLAGLVQGRGAMRGSAAGEAALAVGVGAALQKVANRRLVLLLHGFEKAAQ